MNTKPVNEMNKNERIAAATEFFDNLDEWQPSAARTELARQFNISIEGARKIVGRCQILV